MVLTVAKYGPQYYTCYAVLLNVFSVLICHMSMLVQLCDATYFGLGVHGDIM